jgi:hypothetical protein
MQKGVAEVMVHVDSEPHDHAQVPIAEPRPTSEIEQDILHWGLQGHEQDVKKVSHSTFHYRKDGIEVVLDIILRNEDILFKHAREIAREVEQRLATHPKVIKADVHLETHEHGVSK